MIIAIISEEKKESEVVNCLNLQLNSGYFLFYLFYKFILIGEGTEMWLRARSGDFAMLWYSRMKFS
jgi:hypothetical protein